MTPEEEWRAVVGYEGYYEVSSLGRVRSLDRIVDTKQGPRPFKGRIKALYRRPGKHMVVRLERSGAHQTRMVHLLVIEAFVGPRPVGMEACHNNGDRYDNSAKNLRWDTHSANALDTVRHGTNAWAARDHCSKGHLYTSENTLRYATQPTKRVCRICSQATARAGYLRRLRERSGAA